MQQYYETQPRNALEMPLPLEEQPLYGLERGPVVLPTDRTTDTAPVPGGAFFLGGVLVDCNGQPLEQDAPAASAQPATSRAKAR